jgi:serine/threonine protein phosphatase 1
VQVISTGYFALFLQVEEMMQFKLRKQHAYNELNSFGRDFIVGDLHGQVKQLFKQLAQINFDFKLDRLFSTGDLIGRGDDSIACLNLLTQKWFYPVLGNHEQLFLLGFIASKYWELLKSDNGQWLIDNLNRFDLLIRWKTLIEIAMPLSRTIVVNGLNIGVSHASATPDWTTLQEGILSEGDIWQTLWSRPLQETFCLGIESVDYVVHGHTPVQSVVKVKNRFWIDTYAIKNELSILNLKQLT